MGAHHSEAGLPGGEPPGLLRILRPAGPLPRGLAAAAASLGGAATMHGDRPALAVDPHALLARSGELGLPGGFSSELERVLARHARNCFELRLPRGRRLRLGDPPAIFGIINATPDSFSDGGRNLDPGRALAAALEMIQSGADAIDVGGESTRPGATPVEAAEERRRVEPVIRSIRQASDVPLSIDTTKAEVAKMALNEGADIINDVSALRDDRDMV